jgi:hypothetical protein
MNAMLIVRKQNYLGVESLGIFDGDTFVAYGFNRLRVHQARIEIEKTLRTPVEPVLTQRAIDTRPADEEPQGTIRKLMWKASQQRV